MVEETRVNGGLRKLKRKIVEEPPTLGEEDSDQQLLSLKDGKSTIMNESSMFTPSKSRRVSEDSGSSPNPVDPSNDQVQEENQLSRKLFNKKFCNAQALGEAEMLTRMRESS
ncbi:hypothetical protein E2542_SST12610 [Spatholobus suberectus]|nr:hypothetical protein E2542_SST12610 [Spatholobus suberectus]